MRMAFSVPREGQPEKDHSWQSSEMLEVLALDRLLQIAVGKMSLHTGQGGLRTTEEA